jgi:hypothetical protein
VAGVAQQQASSLGQARDHTVVHTERCGPRHFLYGNLTGNPSVDRRRERAARCGGLNALCLPIVEIADEGDPALVRQRREQDVPLRGGDQVRAVAR